MQNETDLKARKDVLPLDCQVGIGLPPLVNGLTRGEIELRTSRLTIFDIDEQGGDVSVKDEERMAVDHSKHSNNVKQGNKSPTDGEGLVGREGYKVRSLWWGEVGHGSLFKPELYRSSAPLQLDGSTQKPMLSPPQITRITSSNRILFPLRSRWKKVRSYFKDASDQGIRFDVVEEKSLKIVASGTFNLNILDRHCDEENIVAVRSSIKLYDVEYSDLVKLGTSEGIAEKIIGSLDVTVVVRLGRHSLFQKALTHDEAIAMTAHAKKREMIEYKSNHESVRSTILLPSMLSEFELNEVIAKNDCNNLLPVSPMADTEMFHRTSSSFNANKSRLRSSWAETDALFMEEKDSRRIFGTQEKYSNGNDVLSGSKEKPLRVAEVGKRELKNRIRQHFKERSNREKNTKHTQRQQAGGKIKKRIHEVNRLPDKSSPQFLIKGLINAPTRVEHENIPRLGILEQPISCQGAGSDENRQETSEPKEFDNVVIDLQDQEGMGLLENILSRGEALRKKMGKYAALVSTEDHRHVSADAPIPDGSASDIYPEKSGGDQNNNILVASGIIPAALDQDVLDALIEVPEQKAFSDEDLDKLLDLTGKNEMDSNFAKLGTSMKNALLCVSAVNIGINRIVILPSKYIKPRAMKHMAWSTNIEAPDDIVDCTKSKASYSFSSQGSLAEKLTNGTYALASNFNVSVSCNVNESNFDSWLNQNIKMAVYGEDEHVQTKNKGKNASMPGEDHNDFAYAAQISLSQLIIAQDKPLELAVPLQNRSGNLSGFVDVRLALVKGTGQESSSKVESESDFYNVNDLEIESKNDNSEDHMYVPPSDRSTHPKIEVTVYRCNVYNDYIAENNKLMDPKESNIRIIHRPWQAGIINHGSFPWTEEAHGFFVCPGTYIFSHRSISTINLPLEAGESFTADYYIIEVWLGKSLLGLVKVPLDNMSFLGESIAGDHIDIQGVYSGIVNIVDPFTGVVVGEMQLELNVGTAASIRKNWGRKCFAAMRIAAVFKKAKAKQNKKLSNEVERLIHLEQNLQDIADDEVPDENKEHFSSVAHTCYKHSFSISLKSIRGRDGEMAMKDNGMPSFVRYSFPFDFPGSNGGTTTLWWDPSDNEYSSTSVHTLVIGSEVDDGKLFLRQKFQNSRSANVLELELWSWVSKSTTGVNGGDAEESMDNTGLPTCCVLGVAEIPVEEFIQFLDDETEIDRNASKLLEYPVFSANDASWDEAIAFIQVSVSHAAQKIIKTHQGANSVVAEEGNCAKSNSDFSTSISLMQSNNTTRNLLPAKADLVVSLSLKSVNASSVFDDMLWIKHTIYTGIDDIWKTNIFTIESAASNGAVESSTPVDITQGLIEYLEEGEIEFLICNTSNTNDIVGRVVVPLSSFLQQTAGISGSFNISSPAGDGSIGEVSISVFFEHHRTAIIPANDIPIEMESTDITTKTVNGLAQEGQYLLPLIDVNYSVRNVDTLDTLPDTNGKDNIEENEVQIEDSPLLVEISGESDDNNGLTKVTFVVENAQSLQLHDTNVQEGSFLYLTYKWDEFSPTLMTHLVDCEENPSWNYTNDVKLVSQELEDSKLLEKVVIFSLWQRHNSRSIPDGRKVQSLQPPKEIIEGGVFASASLDGDKLLGLVRMELCVVAAGMEEVDGWYNIQNLKGDNIGHIRIGFKIHQLLKKSQDCAKTEFSSSKDINDVMAPNFASPSFKPDHVESVYDKNRVLSPSKSVADVLKKLNEAKGHISKFERNGINHEIPATQINNGMSWRIPQLEDAPHGLYHSSSMEDVLKTIGQISNHIGNLNAKELPVTAINCSIQEVAPRKIADEKVVEATGDDIVVNALEEIEVEEYLDDDFEVEDASEEDRISSSERLLVDEGYSQVSEMTDFKDRKKRLIKEGIEMVQIQNKDERIAENANKSEDNGNEDLSTGCLERTQPVVTENVDQAVELAGGYKSEDPLHHVVAEGDMENLSSRSHAHESRMAKIEAIDEDAKEEVIQAADENEVSEVEAADGDKKDQEAEEMSQTWQSRKPVKVTVDGGKALGEVNDKYVLYLIEKAKREREEKEALYAKLRAEESTNPRLTEDAAIRYEGLATSPTSEHDIPILNQALSPTNNSVRMQQVNLSEEERSQLSLMTQRNMTLWDSNEMNRVKRIFKGTDGDESSVVSSSMDSIRSL